MSERVALSGAWTLWPVAAVRSAGLPFDLLTPFATPDLLDADPGPERNEAIRRASADAGASFVRDERVREALAWQNPGLLDTWWGAYADRLARGEPNRLSNRAYREVMIARYAQRYCAKNESVGFFGPVAWARFAAEGPDLEVHGEGGIRRRTVYLETWAVAELARALRVDDRVLPHLPVRLSPAANLSGGRIRMPHRPAVEPSPVAVRLLRALGDGGRVGDLLAAASAPPPQLPGRPEAPAPPEPEVLRAELLRLEAEGVLQVGFRVPFGERPERSLRVQLDAIPDPAVRADLLARLDRVEAALGSVEAARGPDEVRKSLAELGAVFDDLGCTEASTARRTRHARTPAYLDCRRDTDVRLGPGPVEALRAPLGLLLDSARWLANEVADAVEHELVQRHRQLRAGRPEVNLADLQFAGSDVLSPDGAVAQAVAEDFALRWAEILPAAAGEAEVRLDSGSIRSAIAALFPPSPPRWSAARQHSPDLMLARHRGGLRWVLGELHVALNTLESRVFLTQSDDREELIRLTGEDLAAGRIATVYPPQAPEATSRTYPPLALDPPGRYRYWSYGPDDGGPGAAPTVPGTAVVVHERHGRLIGEVSGQGWGAPVLEFFAEFLTATVVNLFRLRPRAACSPRVLLDEVVVCRRSWSLDLAELPVPAPGRRIADRGYQELREEARRRGMPRHVFVHTPLERKPIYVDLCSPLLVGNLVHALRRAVADDAAEPRTVDVVEMLPAPHQLWLRDGDGRGHTAEFRLMAVDDLAPPRVVRPLITPLSAPPWEAS